MTEKKVEKKLNFFKKVLYSIVKFERYPEMATEGLSSAFKYLAQLMLIFSILVSVGLLYKLQDTAKKGIDYFKVELPDVTYNNGKLDIYSDQAITINTGEAFINKIIIDTKTEENEKIDEYINSIPLNSTGIVVLKDKILIKTGGLDQLRTYSYSEILNSITNSEINVLTKQDIVNYLDGNGIASLYIIFFILMIIYVFITYTISVLVDTLLIALLGNITTLFTRIKLKFSAVYCMSIYALTLSIIINAIYIVINSITGFEIKYFPIMYTSIAYVCLVAALFMLRADFIKKQEELMKIIQEQEKVKQELNDQQDKEEEEQKENKKPEDDDEKNKKEPDNENSNNNKEPDSSEA